NRCRIAQGKSSRDLPLPGLLLRVASRRLKFLLRNGWIYYQSSFYYMSNEGKNWAESRKDCQKRGADLIIINNREEQDFVNKITAKRDFWIGLTDSDVEGRWKWVDGSTLTSGFWASRGQTKEPNGGTQENCAVSYLKNHPRLIEWLDVKRNDAYQWICEKNILPLIQP
uniref:C-type lectin domain-containing protein n=1 Tax=Cyprinus carpio TaxID=7962 RepID=A0A8C2HTT6_CYPCA